MSNPTLVQVIEEGRAFRKDFVSQQIKRGIKANALNGLPSGPVPLGYRLEIVGGQRRAVIDQTVAPLVQEAFRLAATGKYSIRELVDIATEKGLRSRHEKPLQATGLWRILKNPFYFGLMRYQGEIMPGQHAPLVGARTFEQVQKALRKRRQD